MKEVNFFREVDFFLNNVAFSLKEVDFDLSMVFDLTFDIKLNLDFDLTLNFDFDLVLDFDLQKMCNFFLSELRFKKRVMRAFQKGITLGGRTSRSCLLYTSDAADE